MLRRRARCTACAWRCCTAGWRRTARTTSMRRFAAGDDRRARLHDGHRGRRRRRQRHDDGGPRRRPVRRLPAAPAARPGRAAAACRGCACCHRRRPAVAGPRAARRGRRHHRRLRAVPASTSSSAARATSSAPPVRAAAPACGCSVLEHEDVIAAGPRGGRRARRARPDAGRAPRRWPARCSGCTRPTRPTSWRRHDARIIGGARAGRPADQDAHRRQHPADLRPGPRGAVLRASTRPSGRSAGCASSTCTPAAAPSAWRPGPAGQGVVTLVEHDRRTAALIRENAAALGFTGIDVVAVAGRPGPGAHAPGAVRRGVPRPALRRAGRGRGRGAGGPARPRLARPGRAGGRRAVQPGRRPGLAGRASPADRDAEVRRDHALVRSRRTHRAEHEEPPCAEPHAPGRSTRSPTGTSTSSPRAATLFDEVVVAVGVNTSPSSGCSRADERIEMLHRGVRALRQRRGSTSFDGLLTDFCQDPRRASRSSRGCGRSATSTTSCRWRR